VSWQATFARTPARRLALFLPDRLDFTAALLAAWEAGKQVVLPGDVLPATLAALAPHVDAWAGDFPHLVALRAEGPPPARFTLPPLDRELEGVVVFTSGSTGAPLAIPKRLRQLLDEVATLEATFGARLGPDAAVLGTVSHQHIYGLLCSVLWPVSAGRPLSPRRLEYPEELAEAVTRAPCVLVSSPAHLKRLPEGAAWRTQLRAVFSSGGPLPPEGAARARAVLGLEPIELYGSSETGGIAWREGQRQPWQAMRGVRVRASAEGTLELTSPHLADPGWYATADRVRLTGDTFALLGRADRIAKIEEKRVSLELVEATARATGLLAEARALTVQVGGRVGVGLVGVPAPAGAALTRAQLAEALKGALAASVEAVALPRRYRFVDALPVDDQGKVTEARLATLFRPERPEPRWRERDAGRATLALDVGADLRCLDGHFPGAPVVPGVAQLDWAIGWGREAFGLRGEVAEVTALKFQRPLLPGAAVALELTWNPERSTLGFKYTDAAGVYSSGKVLLSP
jgi:acyl-coenzyme A synthetase/AMP-(fatty) acid ligase/3-hydroxymyristoyl/3-hydroxydecanoyl-(acyl carrier protein) dehydratase